MSSEQHPDLSTTAGVFEYASSTPFATDDPSKVVALSGGFANFTFRLHLSTPFKGHHTAILKHAKPYVKIDSSIAFSVKRQVFEAEALRNVRKLLPADSFVTVPEVFLFDEQAHAIFMEDSGEGSMTLKEYVRQGRLQSAEVAKHIGASLARFISLLHDWKSVEKQKLFAENELGKTVKIQTTYGLLPSTLSPEGQAGLEAFQVRPIKLSADEYKAIQEITDRQSQAMAAADQNIVMGDFWTGNILLKFQSDEIARLFVVDWEASSLGIPGVELGQFCAEVDLLRIFHPKTAEFTTAITESFLRTYKVIRHPDAEQAKHALMFWGLHLAVWPPRVDWGGPEQTSEVAEKGLRLLLDTHNADEAFLHRPTELHLPPTLPYPIKVVSIDAPSGATIDRGTRLFSYSFVYVPTSANSQPEPRFGTWDSAIEGTVETWSIKPGDVISQKKAKDKAVVVIIEPCKHGMQLGGLCVYCGKDMTNVDYTGFSDASRAVIQMTHSAFGPTVSLEEAQRIERETAERLLNSRKLSLIVDLDQTILHATVDPTVGEWIAEGEAWEARQKAKAQRSGSKDSGEESDDSSSEEESECNPNWEALKDVKKFLLVGLDSVAAAAARAKGKGKPDITTYYVKPRPGHKTFLKNMAKKYEMHIYTMGTRSYAEEVCTMIDPEGTIFAGRILTRDESGNLNTKSIQRLFPCDTSMVVIIDDRSDVWEWSPNLVKVIPYDFYVGIGDINSTFLPKSEPTPDSFPTKPFPSETKGPPRIANGAPAPGSSTSPVIATTSIAGIDTVPEPTPDETDREEMVKAELLTRNSLALEAQQEERPLAKKQEALEESAPTASTSTDPAGNSQPSPPTGATKHIRKPLLKKDDYELERVEKLLDIVHRRFFAEYDKSAEAFKRQAKRKKDLRPPYDVTRIIPGIRSEVLNGVHILFSGVPDHKQASDVWHLAHLFGAKCSTELTKDITHVVAAKSDTTKVELARKRKGINLVWMAWFTESIAMWKRQPEGAYLIDLEIPPESGGEGVGSSPAADSQQISSDPDPDADDWDHEPSEVQGAVATGDASGTGTAGTSSARTSVGRDVEGDEAPALDLQDIDWNDINDEVEAAMNESDDEDAKSERSAGMRSDDEWTDEQISSATNTPKRSRKRLRSVTPSSEKNGSTGNDEQDILRSPLAKRKKLAADRTGFSKLKVAFNADDLKRKWKNDDGSEVEVGGDSMLLSGDGDRNGKNSRAGSVIGDMEGIEEDEEDEDGEGSGDGGFDEDDDFLAREFGGEEWG
ncbi:hypothetical protein BDN72DRAFT_887951 [Pluteus cervinus]|uniref:Uncharacterized protein n=1 Tax=Pluteus cervinus TaxID=181527 RepID=A0ACD3AXU8_9AGAR|nr:hypothetical protein BDN72DRAFT_887951 [Pluteus cervinus]